MMSSLLKSIQQVLTSRAYFIPIASALLVSESILCFLIIQKVNYTEIDFSTYIQQVTTFLNGETNYTLISGDSGPIVYPAGFLYFYSLISLVSNEGKNIRLAQYIFGGIYVSTMAVVFAILHRCKSVPPYALILMTLSKRLHSIYVLRLFNDGPSMLFLYIGIFFLTTKKPSFTLSTIFFSLALSIKMNILLFLPALAYIMFLSEGLIATLFQLCLMASIQMSLAIPFLEFPTEYFMTAFDFSREFRWEWTVNWRWLGEELFGLEVLGKTLLGFHLLGLVFSLFSWAEKEGGIENLVLRGIKKPFQGAALARKVPSVDAMVTMLFSSNLIGIICSRSLHYQFYAWYAHQIVFLTLKTPFPVPQRLGLLIAIELGWNTFPSTINSSLGLFFANTFLWMGSYYGGGKLNNLIISEETKEEKKL